MMGYAENACQLAQGALAICLASKGVPRDGRTQVDDVREPPGLLLQRQRLGGQVLAHDGLVHAPEQLLALALVHGRDVLVAPDAHDAHNVRGLRAPP